MDLESDAAATMFHLRVGSEQRRSPRPRPPFTADRFIAMLTHSVRHRLPALTAPGALTNEQAKLSLQSGTSLHPCDFRNCWVIQAIIGK